MKKEILETILANLEKDASASQSNFQNLATDDTDPNEQVEIDDISQKDQSTDISDDLNNEAVTLENAVNTIRSFIAVSRNDCIYGALVETEEMLLLIGVSLPPVTVQNKKVIGVSQDSKIYPIIKGKKEGDTITLHEKVHHIISIS